MNLHDARSLGEFLERLKAESGDSNSTLAAKIGVAGSTISRLINDEVKPDDDTLDKIADYAGVTRAWLYELAKGIPSRPRYSRTVSLLAALVEQAPPDVQEDVLALARTLIERRKKAGGKVEKNNGDLGGG